MRAWIEQAYPVLAGVAGGIVYFFVSPEFPVKAEAAPSLFSAIISVSAIAVGFLATANSILLSIDNRPLIVKLKAVGHYTKLLQYLMWAAFWSFSLAGMSVVCFLADLRSPADWHRWLFSAWVFFILTATLACYRIVRLFAKILNAHD
jgi:hypothetical protein